MFLKMLGAVCAVPVLLLVIYYLATWNTAKIQPEQMEAWDRELPVMVEKTTTQPQTTNTELPAPAPKESEAPAKQPALTNDFAVWLHNVKPEASQDDRIAAWRGFFEEGLNHRCVSISGKYRQMCRREARLTGVTIEQF